MPKQRLDTLLVTLNLCSSRQQAQTLIRAGEVKVNQQTIDKPATEIDPNAKIELLAKPKFVSRGGEKLAKALELFQISVKDRICLDGGISTGGFTDCLLQAGAKQVYGVDVGYGQVAWSLRQDERVILKERTNFRYVTPESLYESNTPADLGVMDLSFISLTLVLHPLWDLLIHPKEVILLVKPQFEVGREKVGKNGVVRNSLDQAEAILNILQVAQNLGWSYGGLTWSPITGPAGNIEYLLWLKIADRSFFPTLNNIHEMTDTAFKQLNS
ncbi:TlyA family rRNA (cytidine-2'-O)-methyltransferase [Aphanothece hegewaldii CCALA 016]|uniref:TlyA family rRNA (Cytidine-2'-O)-methyltransferase n=1 Tax=Aphanothece hegewaldii CCALA 016 TaxID=2107694 RepID=A0A2T1M107_9CHRO|nr:TlyA family RNA methyltransferase [Aphanothece hegewaldii]PSF38378.1 TlyA family rRNA (cytidine-2'-O)-methyltransferase [Aphanothece hegewaldii CCALA 016]